MSDTHDSEPVRPRRSRVRRVLRVLGLVIAACFGLLFLGIAWLHSAPGQRWLTGRVRGAIAERIDGRVELSSVEAKLFGVVAVRGLVLAEASGAPVVALDELVVRPSWGDLVRGRIVVDRLEVRGLRLAIEQHPDGSSNLKKLIKPRPAAAPEPAKKSRRVVVSAISLSGIELSLTKPDGSKLVAKDVALEASLDAVASERTVSLAVSRLALGLERIGPDGARLALSELETGLDAHLIEGAGKVKLAPLSARARLVRPARPVFETPIALGGIELDVKSGELGAVIAKLELGLVLLESLDVSAGYSGGALAGEQRATLLGLSLDAQRLNALLGKPVLRENVNVRAQIQGPANDLGVDLTLGSAGARLALDGSVNASRLDRPRYDLKLVGTGIETRKLLASATAPDIGVERFELGVAGEGVKRDELGADIRLDLGKTRVGRVKLDGAKLRGRFERGVLTIRELTIDALDQKIRAEGRYVVATRELDAKLTLSGDVGAALAKLRRAGVPVKSQLPAGTLRLLPGELVVEAKGRLDDAIHIRLPSAKVRVAGGSATIDARLALRRGPPDAQGQRALTLDTVDADVRLSRLDVGTLARMRGKRLPGVSGGVSGHVQVTGTRQAPRIDADLKLDARSEGAPAAVHVALAARGDRGTQHVSVVAERVAGASRDRLLEAEADVPLRLDGKPRLSPGRRLSVNVDLPRRRLEELLELLPKELRARLARVPPDAELEAHVEIEGTTSAPRGSFHVKADAPLAPLSDARQALELRGTIEPDGSGSRLRTKLDVWADRSEKATAHADVDARFARSPLLFGGAKKLDWRLALAVPEQRLEKLPVVGLYALSGTVGADVVLSGTERDAAGTIRVRAADIHRGELGPLGGTLSADLGPERTDLDLQLSAAHFEALHAKGSVGVAGDGLIPKLREKRLGDPALELALDLPRRSFRDWSSLRPKLANLLGGVGGALRVRGSVREPLVDGAITADGFEMLNHAPGRAKLDVSAGPDDIALDLVLGPVGDRPLSVGVRAKRAPLVTLLRSKTGTHTAEVALRVRSDATLGRVLPRLTPALAAMQGRGDFDWNMDGRLVLESREGKRALAEGVVDGTLSIGRGELSIPGSKRRYRDVEVRIASSADAIAIDKLSIRESDRENSARSLDATGRIAWRALKPERVKLALRADDWLLFGGDTLGKPDAPRAALSADIDVDGAIGASRRTVDVVVQKLALRMPDRFDKAHWPEQTSLGDVLYLGEPGVRLGKLPRPSPTPKPHAAPADPARIKALIRVSIPKPIHVQKPPFDMRTRGALEVRLVEGEARPRLEGELIVLDGHMDLGGRDHRISKQHVSRIYFDDAHPGGELDLYVALAPHPVVLRDVSRASAGGDDVRIHLAGPIAKPVSTVTGVGNADLWDILPVHNAGRVKFTSQPDLPVSSTAQVPREYDVVLLSYMAANLPHNLILDRINAWSDSQDDRFAYGKIRHLEAERYSDSGKTRIRVISRPPTTGQSDAELEAGYLLHNAARTKLGVGVVGGNRVGGGPALFFEWASDD